MSPKGDHRKIGFLETTYTKREGKDVALDFLGMLGLLQVLPREWRKRPSGHLPIGPAFREYFGSPAQDVESERRDGFARALAKRSEIDWAMGKGGSSKDLSRAAFRGPRGKRLGFNRLWLGLWGS